MKRSKITLISSILAAALLMMQVLAGCGGTQNAVSSSKASTGSSAASGAVSGSTRTITDVFGRKVEIPTEVKTCAALGSAARLVVYAGGAEKITGCTQMEQKGDAGMPFAYANKDLFKKTTAVASGGSGNADFAEALIELAPDVVFYQDSDTTAIEELSKKTDIPIIGVYGDAFNSHYLTDSIALIGDVLGTKEHAEKVCTAISGWVKDLNDRTKDIPNDKKPKVYPGAVSWSGGHGFTGTYIGYAPLQAINAVNLSDTLKGKDGVEVSMEQIVEWNPDIIFLNPGNMELVNKDYSANKAAIDSLKAVKEGKVYAQVNFNYYWCNMELAIVDAYYAGTIIYPEAFKDVDFEKKAEEVFTTMIGMEYLQVLKDNKIGFDKIKIGG